MKGITMKRIFCLILVLMLVLPSITACVSANDNQSDTTTTTETEQITTTEETHETNNNSTTETTGTTEEEDTSSEIELPETEGYINPVFSAQGGIYTEAVSLTLDLPVGCENYRIFYTVDGTLPTTKSKKYSGAISLLDNANTAVIRAACFNSKGKMVGRVITNTYLKNSDGSFGVWTISITAVPSSLDKIISNPFSSKEIPASVEMITPEGKRVISQTAGIKVFGGSSRGLPQKSFKITARKDGYFDASVYNGKGSFSYPFFSERIVKSGENSGKVLSKYDSIVLRNGGNDSIQATACEPLKASLVRDSLSNRFAAAVCDTFDYANTQFARVYINGEFYGVLDMRENMNDNYVKNIYGVDDDDVVVIKSELDTTRACPNHTNGGSCRYCGSWFFYECDSKKELNDWIALCKKAISATNANYDSVFTEIESKIDIDSFIEFTALNLYVCNTDWPHNNIKIWRYTGETVDGVKITDGKWRFMYRDMDFAFGRYSDGPTAELRTTAEVDTFYRTLGNYIDYGYSQTGYNILYNDALYLQGLLNFCLKNDGFRAKFIDFCHKLASKESTDILLNLTDETYSELQPLMRDHLAAIKGTYDSSYTTKTFASTKKYIKDFIAARPEYFLKYLEKAMSFYK